MSVLARRAREQDDARRRALLGLGDAVFAAVMEEMPRAGSLAVEEAVEAALTQILRKGAHRSDLELAKRWWISWAKLRMIDGRRLSAFRDRDLIPVDEHPAALAHSIIEDPFALDGEGLDAAGLQEILSTLSGRQREWADGLFWLLRHPAIDGAPAAKLHEVLDWSPEMTRKTGQRARETTRAFIEDRASGVICSRRQAVLDAFIMATEAGLRGTAGDVDVDLDVDCRQFQAVVVHLAGCPACQAVWSRRRATLLARCASVALLPVDALAAAAQAFAGKLSGALSGAQNAALSVLARLGVGGGVAAAGGSALTAKTAAVCVGIVCAAGAGTAELTGVLPPIAPDRTPDARQHAKRPAPSATRPPAPKTARAAASLAVAPAPPPPPATVRPATRTVTPPPPPAVSTPQFTPGDLEATSPTSRAAATALSPPPPPPAPPAPPVASTSSSSCTPGDLGC
ncbi:MAG: hypothetical protein QOJ89_2109 [bacterium]